MASEEQTYEPFAVVVRGVAGPTTRAALDDVEVTVVGDTTVLRGVGTDQAALHGLLQRVQELGLEIIEVHQKPKDQT